MTVPVLQDGANPPLWETGCILRYLSTKYANDSFWPNELLSRTEVDRWAEWSKINIAMGFTGPVFWRMVRTPERERNSAEIKRAVINLEEKLAIANARLENQTFLVGDAITLADIQFGHILFRYFDVEIERASLPALEDYYGRLKERPAYQEHVMFAYDDLKV
jgi:glutathione S-transferase